MEIQYYGANCVRFANKQVSISVDDNLDKFGLKNITHPEDISIFTEKDSSNQIGRFLINCPGEYEISEVSIIGLPANSHSDPNKKSTIYSIKINDFNTVIVGNVETGFSDEQLEKLGIVDVLVIPVGGHGLTIDAIGAVELIKKIEPKIAIPTHYADQAINYPVEQSAIAEFLKAMGITEQPEPIKSLAIKDRDLGDKTSVVILERTK